MAGLPTVVTAAGLQPQSPADIRAQLTAKVLSTNPGYTNDLPLSLIEDIASTDVAAILLADAARVDLVNSLSPFAANSFTINQLGQMFGVPLGLPSNTSVFVQFTGTPGFVINKGFTVSDGNYNYVVQDGGIVGADNGSGSGVSPLLFALASVTGTWAVGSGTVQSIKTSVPNTVTLSVNNPVAGIPSEAAETEESYRARVLTAGLASSSGQTTMLKTLLSNVAGVQSRLISIVQLPANRGWEIIVGGGDPYQVGYAIFRSGIDLASIVGSTMSVSGISQAAAMVVTTVLNHGFSSGDIVSLSSSNPANYNQVNKAATVLSEKTFSLPVDSSAFPAYVSGAVITPNNRNVVVSINDFPDTYSVPYVNPPQQVVNVTLVWNTTLPNFVSGAAVAQAGAPAVAAYINSVVVGQPINVFQMEEAFKLSVSDILDPNLITRMIFSVSINGVGTPPVSGTGIIQGDPESYFFTTSSSVTVIQG